MLLESSRVSTISAYLRLVAARGAGVPLITVSAHLGHEDAATLPGSMGTWGRTAGEAAAAAMAKLSDRAIEP